MLTAENAECFTIHILEEHVNYLLALLRATRVIELAEEGGLPIRESLLVRVNGIFESIRLNSGRIFSRCSVTAISLRLLLIRSHGVEDALQVEFEAAV